MIRHPLISVCIIVLLSISANADTHRLVGEASGWGSEAGGTAFGKSNFGQFSAGGVSEIAPFDETNPVFCDIDEFGYPRGVVLSYISFSQVIRYNNGDLMFSELDPNLPSTICFNFNDNVSSTFEVYSVITGGTGRFEGATGWAASRGNGTQLNNMGASSSEFEGEIHMQLGHQHDDGD